MVETRNNRDSSIELLRCLLMFLIVVQHFVAHNILSVDNPVAYGEPNYISSNLLLSFCVCSVNCFVLISGYFGIKFSIRKLVLFLLPILFYEVVMSLIWYPFKHHVSITAFNYWFIRPYVALMILSPILNKGLEYMSKRKLLVLLTTLVVIFILPITSLSGNAGKNILVFLILYITGYYIRHHNMPKYRWGGYFLGYIASSLIVFVEAYLMARLGKGYEVQTVAYYYDNIFVYAASIFLFLAFCKMNIKSKFINWIASSSFFVYIISENENIWKRPFSFYEFINVDSWNQSQYYFAYIIIGAICVFCACILIDKIRKLLFGNLENKIADTIDKLQIKYSIE